MNDPTLVRIEPDKMTVDRVRQVIYYPSNDEKPRLLVGLLKHMDPRRSMVFVNTRRAAEEIEQLLRGNGINAEAISGDVPAAQTPAHAARFPRRHARGADRHRRRLARPAHSRRQPRLQLRPAAGSRRLRASHRPHGARRRRRRCDQFRLRGVRDLAAGHRGLHRPQDCRSQPCRRTCCPRSPRRAPLAPSLASAVAVGRRAVVASRRRTPRRSASRRRTASRQRRHASRPDRQRSANAAAREHADSCAAPSAAERARKAPRKAATTPKQAASAPPARPAARRQAAAEPRLAAD